MMSETISGITLVVQDVFRPCDQKMLMQKFQISYSLVMLPHMVDTLEDIEQQQKFFNQVITSPLFLEMLMSLLNAVQVPKNRERLLKA